MLPNPLSCSPDSSPTSMSGVTSPVRSEEGKGLRALRCCTPTRAGTLMSLRQRGMFSLLPRMALISAVVQPALCCPHSRSQKGAVSPLGHPHREDPHSFPSGSGVIPETTGVGLGPQQQNLGQAAWLSVQPLHSPGTDKSTSQQGPCYPKRVVLSLGLAWLVLALREEPRVTQGVGAIAALLAQGHLIGVVGAAGVSLGHVTHDGDEDAEDEPKCGRTPGWSCRIPSGSASCNSLEMPEPPTLSEFPSIPSSLWFPLRARLPPADIFQLLAQCCSPCLPGFAGLSGGTLHPSIPVLVQPRSVPAPLLFLS